MSNHPLRKHRSNRRALLQGLGLGSLAMGLPWGTPRDAGAAPVAIPKRIVFFYGSGMLYDDWAPTGPGGAGGPTESAWDFGSLHQPLQRFKAQCLYVDGLGMVSEQVDKGPAGNAHNQGAKHALSATDSHKPDMPGGISIDQYIAQGLNRPTPVTAHPSLVLQAASWTNELTLYSGAVAAGPDQPLPGIWNPKDAYTKVFGNFTPPGTDTSLADAARAQQAAVFGLARGDYSRLVDKLAGTDQQRVQAHLDLLNDLESRLALPSNQGATCVKPPSPSDITGCDFSCYGKGPAQDTRNWNLAVDHHSRLITAAFACDLTRVAFLEVNYGADADYGYTSGAFGSTDMHDLIHKVNDRNGSLAKDPAARKIVQDQCRLEATKLAQLLDMLSAVKEADGSTLLDHSVVVYCGQVGYGSHDLSRLPWLLVGSAGGYFRTGRYVRYGNPSALDSGNRGVPHNNLFVSLANAMGIATDTFGNPSVCTGPLDGLRA
jgi:Protein of unknown function (DUF1552)